MILDEILDESREFDRDDMVDIFVEGFLYALEMQEEGQKASSIEELSTSLSEAADTAISELSHALMMKASGKALDQSLDYAKKAKEFNTQQRANLMKSAEKAKQSGRIYAKMSNLDSKRYLKRG